MELHKLDDYLAASSIKPIFMQDGVKFRTLCASCNNERLGLQFDPELKAFGHEAQILLGGSRYLELPSRSVVRLRPQRIARAVVGHLLAAEVRPDMQIPPPDAPFQGALRRYFLDPDVPLPNDIDIYYWLYTGNVQAILRGVGVGKMGRRATPVMDVLKYYPLAFAVVLRTGPGQELIASRLLEDKALGNDDVRDLIIDRRKCLPPSWPENPLPDEFMLFHDSVAYMAKEREGNEP